MDGELDIAIVGMSCRFPGANSLDEFWRNLAGGVESISRLSDEEILASGVPASHLREPNYVKAAPILEEPGGFDAAFFGYSPAEARTMDPQQRILLELAHEALEHAGYDPDRYAGRIGVFTGSALNTYFTNAGLNRRLAEEYIPTLIGNDKDFLSTRISYKLNLKGPSITVQTACSTSLVAIHLARQSLMSRETDIALAGAISVRVPHRAGYFADAGGVVSPDGHVRAFDAKANGTVFGSGGGILVLKRLADAMADGDAIQAVIKGSAVNNDGTEKAGYTAPSVSGQADAVIEALANAGVDADSISYVEAHGSGTPVGDPIEIRALTRAFRTQTRQSGFCAIGSVKTNIGHLDAAAGVAGVIKTVLALKHRQLPPSLHFTQPNPEIDFAASPFYVNAQLCEWASDGPRRAGVMATGMGGTNAHVVLEEAPQLEPLADGPPPHLLILSAKTQTALDQATRRLRDFLRDDKAATMSDVAYTLQAGRKAFPHRRFVVCADRADAIAALGEEHSKKAVSGVAENARRPIVLLLPGVGDQYVGMAYDLYAAWPGFRQDVDRCADLLRPQLGADIRDILYPSHHNWRKRGATKGIDLKRMLGRGTDAAEDADARTLNQTLFAQPALFTIEYATARLWQALGVAPDAIVGHSMGEYVAACLSGVLTLEDALRLIAVRARLVSELPQGAMLAVALSEKDLQPLLPADLSIALINGPQICVVAGPAAAVAEFAGSLAARGVIARQVQNAHAFHSRMLDPIVARLEEEARKLRLGEPRIPYVSNVTGTWIKPREATSPAYWAMHANRTARFDGALQELWKFRDPVLLEAGPGRTLSVLAMQHPDRAAGGDPLAVQSLRHVYENESDTEMLLQGAGRLWLAGAEVRWENCGPGTKRRRVALATYPFERRDFWLHAPGIPEQSAQPPARGTRAALDDWFYVPAWERAPFLEARGHDAGAAGASWLIIADRSGAESALLERLQRHSADVHIARFGAAFRRHADGSFEIDPSSSGDYAELLRATKIAGASLNIVHLGCLVAAAPDADDATRDYRQNFGFFSLLHLAQAIGKRNLPVPVKIGVVSSQIHEVTGDETLDAEMATALGPAGVIPREMPNVACVNVDLAQARISSDLAAAILAEFDQPGPDGVIAYRGRYRWQRKYVPCALPAPAPANVAGAQAAATRLRHRGVYLITGGTGGLGLALAQHLARTCQARIVLTKQSAFPPKSTWQALLDSRDAPAATLETIGQLLALERQGAEVEVLVAEASDREQMQRVIAHTLERFQSLHGVIHLAGIVHPAPIASITREAADRVLAPKVRGTMILHELLRGIDLDFMVLYSSMSSVTAPFAHADYSAANWFLDAFAAQATAQGRFPVRAINWPVWKEAGIGVRSGYYDELEAALGVTGLREEMLKGAMATSDGLEAFTRALSSRQSQLVVSPEDLDDLIAKSRHTPTRPSRARDEPATGPAVAAEAKSAGDRDAPTNEIEAGVEKIWAQVFGHGHIGIHEEFSALGGHSLIAMQIVSKVRSAYGVEFSLKDLFEGPTIAQVSALVRTRSGAVAAKLDGKEQIRALPRAERRALAASERRLWFFDQLEPGSAAYNVAFQLTFDGEVRADALEGALAAVLARHDILRTRYQAQDGEPCALVVPPSAPALTVHEAGGEDPLREASRLVEEDAQRPFDLHAGPLWRALLVRVSPQRLLLGVTLHHVVADGWSVGIFTRELLAAYEALARGLPPQLPQLPFQYADFAAWESEWVGSDDARRQMEFWRERLSGVRALDLPTDFARPRIQTFRGGNCSAQLSDELHQKLGEFSRAHGATPFMTLLAVFGLLLHRLAGEEDVALGVPVAGRGRKGTDQLIGMFINTIVLRQNHSGDPTFAELLGATRRRALEGYSNAEVPFDLVVEEVGAPREAGRSPLFQVLINTLDFSSEMRFSLPGIDIAFKVTEVPASKFDMTLYLGLEEHATRLVLSYNSDLFGAARMQELLAQFQELLGQALQDPERRVSGLSLLTPSAAEALPDPALALDGRASESLPVALAPRMARAAERLAVRDQGTTWTYAELQERADRLARQLLDAGVQRGDVVAIHARRDALLPCAMLGVLQAGAAFAMLDPAYPGTRLSASWRSADPRAVVLLDGAGEPHAALLAEMASLPPERRIHLARTVAPSSEATAGARVSWPAVPPDELAYVAFTSGTTGGVKAILGTHGPVVHFLDWMARTFRLGPDDRFGMLSGLSHDPLLRDVLAPFWVGGSLHVPDPASMGEPGWLGAWIAREGLTAVHLTPAMADLVTSGLGQQIESLKWIFVGGDVVTSGLVESLRHAAPNATCVNFYGATETPQAMAFYVAPRSGPLRARLPVGRGIDDVQLLVLNARDALAGVGELGEIVVRTPHLALGYRGDAELTRQRFTANPLTGDHKDRVYRTGDFGRYLPDGSIEFRGRRDGQVKLRGFRLELGAIETTLSEHPSVAHAVAAVREGPNDERQLAAYVVPRAGMTVNWTVLRAFLRDRLPEYAVPSAFGAIASIPLGPNGKVDRGALPEPAGRDSLASAYEPPLSPTEQVVAAIFAEVLGRARVGRHENFFDLGGHSLLGTRAVSRARSALRVEVSLRALFEAPTPAGLAAHVDAQLRSPGEAMTPIPRVQRGGDLPLSFSQQRLWFLHQLDPQGAAYNLTSAMLLKGRLDRVALGGALRAIVARHEPLRTVFRNRAGMPVQEVQASLAEETELREVAAEAYTDEELKLAVNAEAKKPFDLESGPLLRAFLYRRSDTEHLLMLCAHHIALDAWSFGIIARELSKFYEQRVSGSVSVGSSALPPLPVTYVDYACWQRERLQGQESRRLLDYWRGALKGAPQELALPADRPRPPVETNRGARFHFVLPAELQTQLLELSRREGATLFMTLFSGFALLLSRYSGQRDLLIGTPVAGRNRAEVESLIGFFVNTLVLRADFAGEPSVREFLARMRETCLDAYAHQELPFEHLVDEMRPARDLSRNPLFQVMFVLQNASTRELVLPGMTAVPIELDHGAAQFDLTLNVQEASQGLRGYFEYATDLFDESTIARMAVHWQLLLEAMVASPERSIWELPMLSAAERQQVLGDWSGATEDMPSDRCLHELIAEQAVRSPEAIAVVSGGRGLSYAALERRANQLAHALRKRGVGPEVLVGLCVRRSADMIVALLGVLKAGGAYVPLDPDYPGERLAFMLEDCGAKVIVTEERLRVSLPPLQAGCQVFSLDQEAATLALEPGTAPDSGVGPASLAYAIYTSGSTGLPKAALLTHKGLSNLAQAEFRLYGVGPRSRVLQFASLSFDTSLSDIAMALCSGATLHVEARETLPLGPDLERYLARERITVLSLTPSALAMLDPAAGPALEQIIVGGEACPPELAARWCHRCRFFNTYGPTETAVTTTYAEYREGLQPPLIGRPLPNVRTYLLDERLKPVPAGVPGELYIGGAGVARGYLKRPELTTARFVPDPFAAGGEARMYRSGDFARWRSDGQIEFIGRRDDQIKIRGFRVELGEIEAAISRLPSVQACAVIARGTSVGDRSLAGYVVLRKDAPADMAALRTELRRHLPEYMVPAHLVALESLPSTPNGKVDRKALPDPKALGVLQGTGGYAAPRNDLEISMATVWQEVLGVPQVGINDNFFELGGNSLSVVKLVFGMKAATGFDIDLGEVFRSPTIAQLVASLGPDASTNASVIVPLQSEGSGLPLFCICGIVIYKEFAQSLGKEQPVYGVYVKEEQAIVNQVMRGEKPEVSIERLVDAYHQAIVRFCPHGPYRLAGLSFGGILAMELAAKLRKSGAEVELVLLLDALLPQAARHNWRKWVLHQVAGIAEGKGLAKLRGLSERLRKSIGMRWSQLAARKDVDEPLLVRGVALLEGSIRWQMRHSAYDFRTILFRASNHLPYVDLEEDYGWGRYLGDRLTIVDTTGGHRSIIEQPNVAELGRKVRRYLEPGPGK